MWSRHSSNRPSLQERALDLVSMLPEAKVTIAGSTARILSTTQLCLRT